MITIGININGDYVASAMKCDKARIGEVSKAVYEIEKIKLQLLNIKFKKNG